MKIYRLIISEEISEKYLSVIDDERMRLTGWFLSLITFAEKILAVEVYFTLSVCLWLKERRCLRVYLLISMSDFFYCFFWTVLVWKRNYKKTSRRVVRTMSSYPNIGMVDLSRNVKFWKYRHGETELGNFWNSQHGLTQALCMRLGRPNFYEAFDVCVSKESQVIHANVSSIFDN